MLEKICEPIKEELKELEINFKSVIKTDVQLIKDIFTHIVSSKGKRLRPILLFLCSGLNGKPTKKTMQAATIVELLHTATLIHDDVVDNSDLRRGIPSINSIWDNKISVLIGDYLFAQIFSYLVQINDIKIIKIIADVTTQMSQGEILQMERAQDFLMDEEIYMRLISNKTASLIAATCKLGALSSNSADSEHIENMRIFGESLGIAFQIKDDLLDYYGTEKKLGKPICKDLLENIITLPVLFCLQQADKNKRDELLSILKNGQEDQIKTVVQFVKDTGGIQYAEKRAEFFIQKALHCLDRYEESPYKESLILLSDFITSRKN